MPGGYAGVNGGQSIYHFGTRASYTGSGPVYQPHLFRPAHAQVLIKRKSKPFSFLFPSELFRALVLRFSFCGLQVESVIGEGGMVLQKAQNNLQKRFLQNGGSASRTGGFVRECGGTGVFLPRVAAPATPSSGHARKHSKCFRIILSVVLTLWVILG